MDDLNSRFGEALALQQAERFREALEIYREISDRVLTTNLACNATACLMMLGELDEALAWFRKAQGARPAHPAVLEASLQLGAALLAAGRYAEGWPLMEARIALHPGAVPPMAAAIPEWMGEALAGRSILIWVEQGLGDQIMCVRFAEDLAARGAQVTVACRPSLVDLFAAMPSVTAAVPAARGEVAVVGRHDFYTRYMSLPLRLGTTLETLTGGPYLRPPADRLARGSGRTGIGVMWRTSATGGNASAKTLPEDQAQRLLDLGAVSLQPEDTGVADFADTAAIIDQLDLVISVDTSVAHLAGAMGKPCWTLLPATRPDWRWLADRADSPWYASMRLFRQRRAGDWASVIDEVLAADPLSQRRG